MQDINFNNLETAVNDTEELIPFLDETLAKNAWLITTYHAIGHTDSTYGFYTMDNFISDLEEIKARDFWVASMNDVTLYIYERNPDTGNIFRRKRGSYKNKELIQNILRFISEKI